jgi:hypothetical protein
MISFDSNLKTRSSRKSIFGILNSDVLHYKYVTYEHRKKGQFGTAWHHNCRYHLIDLYGEHDHDRTC